MSSQKINTANEAVISQKIAEQIEANPKQVTAAVQMLDAGDTVPFISRYRKEATGGLSDTQLRLLEERLLYLRELETRRAAILGTIDEMGKLDDILQRRIANAETKSELEDLYLPFKKKRKTKGQTAIAAGLEPLADSLWRDASQDPQLLAAEYIDAESGYADTKAVLDGAKYILMERFAEDATLIARLRDQLLEKGYLCAALIDEKAADAEKFQDYFDYQERYSQVPSHRALAVFRGRNAGVLSASIKMQQADGEFGDEACVSTVASHVGFADAGAPADRWREQVVSWTWKVKLSTHLETDLMSRLRTAAEEEAIKVFANNLKSLLLAAPAGERCTLGLDPGYRSGVKVVVVNDNGKLLDYTTIYPHAPQKQWSQSVATLRALCEKHKVGLIAVGNGTASRETDQLADELIKNTQQKGVTKVMVSEAGASVYSASEAAEREFPELDVTIRGAVSIARRLQDPLAELVKIEPKAIGVGQYQHDVSQVALARSLDATVEDCVNSVGVDLNTASVELLSRVAGLGATLASNIVEFRDQHGTFTERKQIAKVPRLGPKAFEQSAGFLRIANGKNPLEASGVHPEAYPVVKKIAAKTKVSIDELFGNREVISQLKAGDFADEQFGEPTVKDILDELLKPGRDPRPEFKVAKFSDGVESIKDLTLNQVLEGQVSNVTNFGAFVDIGVHQDGLVHISAISDTFVKNPHEVLKTGDIVKVKVMSVDAARNRIGLSMRLTDDANEPNGTHQARGPKDKTSAHSKSGGRSSEGSTNKHRSASNRAPNSRASNKGASHKNGSSSYQRGNAKSEQNATSAFAESLKAALKDKQ